MNFYIFVLKKQNNQLCKSNTDKKLEESEYCKKAVTRFFKEALTIIQTSYINSSLSKLDEIKFTLDECSIVDEFRILNIMEAICAELEFDDFYKCLIGKNEKFSISFSFDKTTFLAHARFDNLCCCDLSFYNTTFEKGALLRWITANKVIFRPWKLGADVTFGNAGYANLDDKRLYVEDRGSIKKFKFRHNLEGSGWTYFIGVKFIEKADFTNTVLDKVHFGNVDMKNCYFFNAIIQDTRFVNCEFPRSKNLWTATIAKKVFHRLSPMKQAIFSGLFIIVAFFIFYYEAIILPQNPNAMILVLLFCVSLLFLYVLNYSFMFITRLLPFSKHFSTADEQLVFIKSDPITFSKKLANLREIYKQLRTNFESNNDYQTAGEFYFSQRHIELAQFDFEGETKSLSQQMLMNALHWINGFGERWVRTILWIVCTILLFSFIYQPNSDYVATQNTPTFLLDINSSYNENQDISIIEYEKNYLLLQELIFKDEKTNEFKNTANIFGELQVTSSNKLKKYVLKLNDFYSTKVIYSISHFTIPLISKEKQWFTTISKKAYFFGVLETLLLWLFIFSLAVSIKNKIKR